MSSYWNYYDDKFNWKTESSILNPSFEYTLHKLQGEGLSIDESTKLFNSGFICFDGFDILLTDFTVDHYHHLICRQGSQLMKQKIY